MKFSLVPVALAFALVACKAPVKLDNASVEDRQAVAAAAEKSQTPILGSSLLKDAANAARSTTVAPLDLASKDASAGGVGAGNLARSNASSTSAASGASGSAAGGSAASGGSAAGGSAAAASAGSRLAASAAADAAALAAKDRSIVYFDFDSFVIRPEARPLIEAHARRLRADAKLRVALEGHTDERGGREYNLGLGQKRADAVRKALSLLGVSDSQMEAVSFGKEKPAVPGISEAAMQENRRVEINYR